ncbi:MAG: hypothetical protein K2W82_17735 [Candidatus Obscuribacterales bacterium]|nr:hypothetical protein [Candidatus Obscuribacterales bacterium]
MSDRELARQFRKAALDKGLLYGSWIKECGDSNSGHRFNLAAGEITARPEEFRVRDLVLLAFELAPAGWDGEHLALLGLVADREDIAAFEAGRLRRLSWRCAEETDQDMSLRDWLAGHGYVFAFGGRYSYTPRHMSLAEMVCELALLYGKLAGVTALDNELSELDPTAGPERLVLVPLADLPPGFVVPREPMSSVEREFAEESSVARGGQLVLVRIDHQPEFAATPSLSGVNRELLEEMDPRLVELTERFRRGPVTSIPPGTYQVYELEHGLTASPVQTVEYIGQSGTPPQAVAPQGSLDEAFWGGVGSKLDENGPKLPVFSKFSQLPGKESLPTRLRLLISGTGVPEVRLADEN